MARQVIEGLKPTRMELIRLKERVKLAERGRDLLKEKRDALVLEFFDVMRLVREAREAANRATARAHRALSICYAALGTAETRQISTYSRGKPETSLGSRNVMGVVVPVLEFSSSRKGLVDRGQPLLGGSSRLDEASGAFEEALDSILGLATAEERARRIARELEKTKRRVSALDHIIVPKLQASIRLIEDRLEELERENFSRLKRIKALLVSKPG